MKSIPLRTEPTVRQADAILARIEGVLTARGVTPKRRGLELRFKVPPPWRAPRLGVLMAVTTGVVKVSAGAGERWKVRYSLDYTMLRALAVVLTIAAVIYGLSSWPRLTLLNVVIGIWVLWFLAPRWIANRHFDALVRDSATEVLERRSAPREVPAATDATPR
jgi:hypothetical protein